MPIVALDAKFVPRAKCQNKDRTFYWDSSLPGFGLQVTANGARSFVVQYRRRGDPVHTSRRMKLKASTLKEARREAKILLCGVESGRDPLGDKRSAKIAREGTLQRIAETEYLAHPKIKKLRSIDSRRSIFRLYIFPTLGNRPITDIKRREIVKMLDKVAEKNGPGAAATAFRLLSAFFNWYAARDDDFRSPIVRGTYRPEKGDGARTLTDDEIRILWNVAKEGRAPYDHFLRFTLLTATRLRESAEMRRDELTNGSWTIPASRFKGGRPHLVPLSTAANEVLANVPTLGDMYVFTPDGRKPISGFSNSKKAFDKRLQAALEAEGGATRERIIAALQERYPGKNYQPFGKGWSPHSLRKTARSLLSRAGIDRDTAERCLGHVEGGIVGAYNHHDYRPEKAAAFEALAHEVERIVSGQSANVISMTGVRR